MRVLVACEYSGTVREAFRRAGHDAWSCDILPTEIPGNHCQCDLREVLYSYQWDIIIGFPPCTNLCASGAQYWPAKIADGRQQAAHAFVMMIHEAGERVAIENPVGALSRLWRKPNQIFHPFHFGDPYMKKTCLWLKGLPPLIHTDVVAPVARWHSGSTRGGMTRAGHRTKATLPALHASPRERSRSFQGIADAMADQWGAPKSHQLTVTLSA